MVVGDGTLIHACVQLGVVVTHGCTIRCRIHVVVARVPFHTPPPLGTVAGRLEHGTLEVATTPHSGHVQKRARHLVLQVVGGHEVAPRHALLGDGPTDEGFARASRGVDEQKAVRVVLCPLDGVSLLVPPLGDGRVDGGAEATLWQLYAPFQAPLKGAHFVPTG